MPRLTVEQAVRQAIEFLRAGRLQEAESLARQILEHAPNYPPALECLALAAQQQGRAQEAADLLRRAIAIDPARAEYRYNLAISLEALGNLTQAEGEFRGAIRLKPDLSPAHMNLGALLLRTGKPDDAILEFREVVQLRPSEPWGYLNLGKALRARDELDQAEAAFRAAIRIASQFAPAHNMLGSCLREGGRIREALDSYRTAIRLDPNLREAQSNLCYGMYFDPEARPEEILEQHIQWDKRFAEPLRHLIRPHENVPDPRRTSTSSVESRLRIGYVSPNLRFHVVGFFMEPVLERHDKSQFEVFCYCDAPVQDDLARRLQGHADAWRQTGGMRDEQLAELVRQDRIDILVDLNLHMRDCRLGGFARKPAPVQITYLGYCGTTGLGTMDWCIADPQMLSAGVERYFTERLLPLPDCYWCYRASPTAPDVGPLPAGQRGYVTFGCLNTLAKVNDRVIQTWAKLLDVVPGSRLAVHIPGGTGNRSVVDRFSARGIPMDRLEPLPRRGRDEYLDLYNGIDIALDPFPYNGGTTTFDALWMGVPVIALAGELPLARAGVTILTNLGASEWVAQDLAGYVERASRLTTNVEQLSDIRSGLRDRLQRSVLMDEPRYVRNLEEAYRSAWRTWCDSLSL